MSGKFVARLIKSAKIVLVILAIAAFFVAGVCAVLIQLQVIR